MKRIHPIQIIIPFFACLLFSTSCKHAPFTDEVTPSNPGNPNPPVDTSGGIPTGSPCNENTIYFEDEILPILVSNCAISGCHNAATAEDGIILNSYLNVVNTGDVRPFQPDNSDLFEVITETDPDKVMPPPGQNPLLASQISLIEEWILQGAQNLTCIDSSICNTDQISFSGFIFPLIQNKCLGCHSGNNPGAGLNFSSHSGITAAANSGSLLGAISHDPAYSSMPQDGQMLSPCEISKFESWINAGAPNN